MWRVTWRNLLAGKVRLLLSGLAIVLGVAFVVGSFILTDSIKDAFTGIIKGSTADVEVTPRGAGDFGSAPDSRTIPGRIIDRLSTLPGAAAVHGSNQVQGVYVLDKVGHVVDSSFGLALDYSDTRAITGNRILTLVQGKRPVGPDQIALDEQTVEQAGYHLGDTVSLVTPGRPPQLTATLRGIVHFGQAGDTAGASLTVFGRQAIQDLFFQGRNVYTGVSLTGGPGVSQVELAAEAQHLLPPGLQARTGDRVAAAGEKSVSQTLGFLQDFLLTFAAISLIVGIFLIVNTFSILVAQRTRELALLRAVGASKSQVNRSVLLEAMVVGLLGTSAGVGGGYLLAVALRWIFARTGMELVGMSLPIAGRTIVAAYLAGIVTTLVAAYLPARRASTISPVAAMRDDIALPESSLRQRTEVGVLLVLLGTATAVGGRLAAGSLGLLAVGIGTLAVLVGVALMSPVLGRPVILVIGWAYLATYGAVGRLATQNSLRNPRRTAATAGALMIGLALVATMAIVGQSAKASTTRAINETLTADLVVSNAVSTPFSPTIAKRIREQPGVQTVAEYRSAVGEVDGSSSFLGAFDSEELPMVLAITMRVGTVAALNDNTILVDNNKADQYGYHVGDTVDVMLQGGMRHLEIAGIFAASAALPANYILTFGALLNGALKPQDSLLFITPKPGISSARLRDQVSPITSALPTIVLQNQSGFADSQNQQIDRFIYTIYALLAFSILIAALGIVNTLALSVLERTREVGLLRAIGLSRRQLRRMVRLESISIAVLGAVLGMTIGVAFGMALVTVLADKGLDVLVVPWLQLGGCVLGAAGIGVLASVAPARRAARMNVLDAISTQ